MVWGCRFPVPGDSKSATLIRTFVFYFLELSKPLSFTFDNNSYTQFKKKAS